MWSLKVIKVDEPQTASLKIHFIQSKKQNKKNGTFRSKRKTTMG